MTRSLKKNPFVGRTTGIEPAHGGFTIHCLDPLGYIRPLRVSTL
uniref:Ribosomal protein S19 n=1 Tax=Viburnum burejaeticum TaxID=1190427 RepID=A0A7M3T1M3_9DIPS|nr:ribosomal protein S19 [Viburnum burejaeticum]QES95220.1 ribosomal protein S19 [Viburnum burejaeticum]